MKIKVVKKATKSVPTPGCPFILEDMEKNR